MKVTASSYNGPPATGLPKRSTQKQAAQAGEKVSLFDKYLHLKVPKNIVWTKENDTPHRQLMYDYEDWKKTRPELELPASKGWTEENLAFLREHYPGDLSMFEVVDAIETMYSMGAMSWNEHNWVSNSPMIAMSPDFLGVHRLADCYDPSEFDNGAWRASPLVGFFTLDDIFSWLEEFRKEDHPEVISFEEAQRLGMEWPTID